MIHQRCTPTPPRHAPQRTATPRPGRGSMHTGTQGARRSKAERGGAGVAEALFALDHWLGTGAPDALRRYHHLMGIHPAPETFSVRESVGSIAISARSIDKGPFFLSTPLHSLLTVILSTRCIYRNRSYTCHISGYLYKCDLAVVFLAPPARDVTRLYYCSTGPAHQFLGCGTCGKYFEWFCRMDKGMGLEGPARINLHTLSAAISLEPCWRPAGDRLEPLLAGM